ncbi:cellulase family glycosylhydrolase [Streptomyces aidingensis]|uniref:Endo-1,4-beta-mannosidase n=1 Tax=Streptomyces aidingensis TaxID=910347 RepID=A0A1I1IW48_9ACTN|nr:cellulase family glycosylhydrolase [Streptomyces aidingensis]SFC39942.1 Endo-1,4-beta-mannosidase [Streptomyces aidingensis]
MQRPSPRLAAGGHPVTWLGVNFWSRSGGPLMWRNYDGDLVTGELRTLRDHGLNMTRSFFYWPDFHPEPDRIDEQMCARYRDFLDRHRALGMTTVPTFIVGHMSGENWDPPWRQGRDLYTDVWMVARQAWFAREMAGRFGSHPAVAGWLISNEMPIYGSPPGEPEAGREAVAAWAQLLTDAVRAGGAAQPVSLGDGAWGLENTGHDNGFRLRDAAGLCDFLGPHVYPMGDDPVRQHYAAAWLCELTGTFGRPVILEEFGLSSAFASAGSSARYYRQALHNSLLAGATGWVAWNNTDYEHLREQPPYSHHAFEMYFGVTDSAGRPKAPLKELASFGALLERIGFGALRRADTDTALLVPSYLDTVHPFTRPEDRTQVAQTGRQAWIAARLADAPAAVLRESDGLDGAAGGRARLLLVPSVKQLRSATWYRLEELARLGSTVYVSYCPGFHDEQRGPWYARLDELFGVAHGLEYGLVDRIEDDEVVFTLRAPLGDLAEGGRLRFPARHGTASGRAFLPVEPAGPDPAEVLAVDAHGRPALLRRAVGAGALVLCTYPLEYLAALTPRINPEDTAVLYGALAEAAGVRRPVLVPDTRVAVDRLEHPDGRVFVWLVGQSREEITVEPVVRDGRTLLTLDGAPAGKVTLEPHGVAVLRLDGPG